MKKYVWISLLCMLACSAPQQEDKSSTHSEVNTARTGGFTWDNATMYFLLIDRFANGDTTNDVTLGRDQETAVARGFMGGDIRGIINKVEEGYFNELGINSIWFTPPVEQVHGIVDEGTGRTYGYHGYWARDWTALDPNFGDMEDLAELVKTAHKHGIRIVFDVVLNHTGPVTEEDAAWPEYWVRRDPTCTYVDAETTITCTLVDNLPDIRTESEEEVELPQFLVDKWKQEGRYEEEVKELDEFFARTGYPRAPKYYIIKWLTDYVREFGIDGFRVDTAKHVEDSVWGILYREVVAAFEEWKNTNPDAVLDDENFYMVGEVYNYAIGHGKNFPIGPDEYIDFYDDGFKSLINFSFKYDIRNGLDSTYSAYSTMLHTGELSGKSVLNYLSSHDDGDPYDRNRSEPLKAGTMLLLAPGGAQIYYGDELARPLTVPGAEGDAHLRSFMNWEDLEGKGSDIFRHWSKLGKFRRDHPAVGGGLHETLSAEPFVFTRTLSNDSFEDKVLVGLEVEGSIPVGGVFEEGTVLTDAYSGKEYQVTEGKVLLDGPSSVVLLAE